MTFMAFETDGKAGQGTAAFSKDAMALSMYPMTFWLNAWQLSTSFWLESSRRMMDPNAKGLPVDAPANDGAVHHANMLDVPAAPSAVPLNVLSLEQSPVMTQPIGLPEARHGLADDLKMISGIGPKIEKTLHSLGIFHFDQIATWSEAELQWVDHYLNFKGRAVREDWQKQAEALARGGREEYARVFGKDPR